MWRERAVLALVARAVAYERGEGVAKDPALAAMLYCEAAQSGDPDAQFGLG
jgi:TPR repeat protein